LCRKRLLLKAITCWHVKFSSLLLEHWTRQLWSLWSSHIRLNLGDSSRHTGEQFHACLRYQHIVFNSHLPPQFHTCTAPVLLLTSLTFSKDPKRIDPRTIKLMTIARLFENPIRQ